MAKIVDRVLCVLLILGACGHSAGSIMAYRTQPMVLLWALSTSLFVFLLAAVNLLRTARPGDRALALIAAIASLCWLGGAIAFGLLIGNLLDPRPLIFSVLSIGLAAFGFYGALRARP